jgi:penicillin-binding protein 1A
VLDPMTAYQITSMMEGVVQRGTATSLRALNKPIAGKTGTTNDAKDAWFVGFSPDLAVGVYVGYDTPRSLGGSATGGSLAAPIFQDFMKRGAGRQARAVPFRVPTGIKLIRIDPRTGLRAGAGSPARSSRRSSRAPRRRIRIRSSAIRIRASARSSRRADRPRKRRRRHRNR